ncbi:MAG: VWA domain-containing protein [Coriobacteriia bacterium]|nr:VWA domain-containing protein [Coriobacteriia bacterium]
MTSKPKPETERKSEPKDQEERSILINFVLDKSGSMDTIREATISGFNEFLGDQQREGGDARMTLTLFDTRFQTVASAVPVREITSLDPGTYMPSGMTALYDAIGHTMSITNAYVAAHRPDQVLFVIMTDGLENASREFDQRKIFELIKERQEAAGYEFIYLGANQDAYAASESIGIAADRAMNWEATPAAAAATMTRVSHNVRAHRRSGMGQQADGTFFSPAFEAEGSMDYDEHKRRKDSEAGK